MLHDIRDKTSTYRVTKTVDGTSTLYAVTVYPKQSPHVEEPIATGMYRTDTLPKWMLEGIYTLDLSGQVEVHIPFFGDKKGDNYWFFSDGLYAEAQLSFMSPGFYWCWTMELLHAKD